MSNPEETTATADVKTEAPPVDPTKTHQVAEFKHETPLTTCRIDPTGRYVFAGAEDLHVHRWDLDSGEKTTLTGHESWVRTIDFSLDGKHLYTAGWDGQIGWWETSAAQPQNERMIQAHRGFARWVQTSPCGMMFATCGNDSLIRVWDANNGEKIAEMSGHKRHPYAVVFHPSDGKLASEDLMGVIHTWDLKTQSGVETIDASVMTGFDLKFAADMGGARDMRFNGDGSILACAGVTNVVNAFAGTQDPIICLIDWATKSITHLLRQKSTSAGIAWGVRFHLDGFIVGAIAKQNGKGELHFWRPDDAKAESVLDAAKKDTSKSESNKPIDLKPFHTMDLAKCARGLDFTPDARRLAIAHSDGNLRVYEMAQKPAEEKVESAKT